MPSSRPETTNNIVDQCDISSLPKATSPIEIFFQWGLPTETSEHRI